MNHSSFLKLGERTDKCRKMNHDCNGGSNCFEKKYRCQLGKLDHLFPGNNGMTDIDGYCFVNGNKFFLEWKTSNKGVQPKQMSALLALSKDALVIVAWGDPMQMIPTSFIVLRNGKEDGRYNGDQALLEFDRIIKEWGIGKRSRTAAISGNTNCGE
jgi:hypothetical protein